MKKLSERTKESFTFLSAFINTELRLLTLEKLQRFRAGCKREHYHLGLTESKPTLRSQISGEGDLGRWFISSSADLLNLLPGHSEAHWSQADMPARLAQGRLATLLRALLLLHVGQVSDYLLHLKQLLQLKLSSCNHSCPAGSNQQVSQVKAVFTISAWISELTQQGQQRRHTLTFVPVLAPAQSQPARTTAAHWIAIACFG